MKRFVEARNSSGYITATDSKGIENKTKRTRNIRIITKRIYKKEAKKIKREEGEVEAREEKRKIQFLNRV